MHEVPAGLVDSSLRPLPPKAEVVHAQAHKRAM